jgi:peptidylprolyl isomerase
VPEIKAPWQDAFTLRYQDIQAGTGADAEPNKLYTVKYTGWLASDGTKFDASDDHRSPVMDKDHKPVLDKDGKPVMGDPQPFKFPQGYGRLIAGWDQGFYGMKIGGKRRLFIPWQLAYGAKGRPGPNPEHPGIPAKADLIFDVELVAVEDMPMPAGHPGMGGAPGMHPAPGAPGAPGAKPPTPGAPAAPATPASAPAAATPAAPVAAPAPAKPATPPAPAAPATPPTK